MNKVIETESATRYAVHEKPVRYTLKPNNNVCSIFILTETNAIVKRT